MSATGGAVMVMCTPGTLDAVLSDEGDRQVKSIYESVLKSGDTLRVGDLFGDLIVERVAPEVTRILVLLNGFVILNLPYEYFWAHRTDSVRLSSFFTKFNDTSFGGLYHHFFGDNVFELRVEGTDAPGAAMMHLEHYVCESPMRDVLARKLDADKETKIIMHTPVTYLFPGRGEAVEIKGELVTSMHFAKPLVAGIVHALQIQRTPALDCALLVRVVINKMPCVSISPRGIKLTQKDHDAPVWTIPLGFRNKLGDATHGVNGTRTDMFEVEIVWDPTKESAERYLTISLLQVTPWMTFHERMSIFGSIKEKLPTPKFKSLAPMVLHGGSDPTLEINALAITNLVKNTYKVSHDWAALHQLCANVRWLSAYPASNNHEGFWSGDYGADGCPIPIPGDDPVDPAFIEKLQTIQEGANQTEYLGISGCLVCGHMTKMTTYSDILGDDTMWHWTSLLVHYYTDHNVKPSDEFYQAVMAF